MFLPVIALIFSFASPPESLDGAKDFIRLGRYLEAVGLCREFIEMSDDAELNAQAQMLIADTLNTMLDQPEAALKEYDRLMSDYPESNLFDDALYRSALLLYRLGRYEQTIESIQQLQREFSDKPESFYNVYNSKLLLEKCQEALGKPEHPPVPAKPIPQADTIRVAILSHVTFVQVSCDADFHARTPSKSLRFRAGETVEVSAYGRTVHLRPPDSFAESLVIGADANPGHSLDVNGVRYRGMLRLYPAGDALLVVNELSLEEYLYGVLPKEMPTSWPMETLKAQAVAARTFALSRKRNAQTPLYDLDDTRNSQRYEGADTEVPNVRRAVDATRGEVMLFDGKLVTACYHANSGGITANSEDTWGVALPYLVSLQDPYSRNSPVYQWQIRIPEDSLNQGLASLLGIPNPEIQSMRVVERDSTGRAKLIEIAHAEGRSRIPARQFRQAFDSTKVKSTLLELALDGRTLEVSGRGYGHGVGMSQWGAKNMAIEGKSYREILGFYYPGMEVTGLPVEE